MFKDFSSVFKLKVKFKPLQNEKGMVAVKEATWSKSHDA